MSAIHRVDDIWSMNGPRFFRLAWRLPCYRGVMRERVLKEQQDREPVQPASQPGAGTPRHMSAAQAVPVTKALVQSDPELARIFSFGS